MFLTLEGVQPGSFLLGQARLSGIEKDPAALVYFSFVTLRAYPKNAEDDILGSPP
jgi:hypothetical protein